MENICSPFSTVSSNQTPSVYNKCFNDFFLTFLVDSIWGFLIALELSIRKKHSQQHPASALVTMQILCIVSNFLVITLLLFAIDVQKVSGAGFLGLLSQVLFWIVNLYAYQFSYQKSGYMQTHLFTMKLFWTLRPLWIVFKFIVFGLAFGYDKEDTEPSILIETLTMVPMVVAMAIFFYLAIKSCRSSSQQSRYMPIGDFSEDFIQVEKEETEKNPYEKATIFNRLLVIWIFPLLKLGNRKFLEESDIGPARKIETSEYQKAKMRYYVEQYLSDRESKYALMRAVYRRFFKEIVTLGAIGGLMTVLQFSAAVFIKFIEDFLMGDYPYWRGFALVSYMLLCKIIQAITSNHFRFSTAVLGAHIRAGLSSTIFDKSLKISSSLMTQTSGEGESNYTYAQVINLMQVDLERIATGIPFSMRAIIWPFQITIGVYLMFATIGWQGSTAGIVLMIFLFVINGGVARYMGNLQKVAMGKKDVRMKYCNELLNNMKVFKLYNWEKKIADRVKKARQVEMSLTVKYLRALVGVIFLNWGTRNYLIISVIVTMSLTSQTLTPGNIFSGITVIGILNMSIRFIPDIISNFMNMIVALQRIQGYLQCKQIYHFLDREAAASNPGIAIKMTDASFSWDNMQENPEGELREAKTIIKDLNIQIKKGEFVAVVGRVGAGKSSIFQALIQNMNLVRTSDQTQVFINGTVSYVSQQAWIQNCSIKDNILFGNPYEEGKYQEIIDVCSLKSDLEILPGGDQTEIGEKGINLSGGQKTRVALARAVYADHDLFFLDDPLSAVDAHVGADIFKECFLGYLRGKTRVLVTNNQQFLPLVDRIIVLNEGQVIEQGNYHDLILKEGYFANEFIVVSDTPEMQRRQSSSVVEQEVEEEQQKAKPQPTKIIENEERALGKVGLWVYKTFFGYMGGMKVVILTIFFMLCWQADRMYADLFLGQWTEESQSQQKRNMTKNLLIYCIASFSVNLFILFRLIVTVTGTIKAAKTIFIKMLKALVNAPVNKYYDITPIGRILNRLSKDQATLDGPMSFALNGTIGQVFQVIMIICICAYIIPYILIIVPIALYFSIKIQNFYLSSSRELMRLESMSRSPIINHFSQTISGTNIIRAFGFQNQFLHRNASLLNNNMAIFFNQMGANAWLGISLEFVADMLLTLSAFLIVGTKGMVDPGLAGVCLTYAVTLPDNIYFMIFASSYLENMMVSVERTHQLSEIAPEAQRKRHKDSGLKQENWPEEGQIEFVNYQMKYRDDTELVLRGVNGVIYPREKIGIVGRTGSGKSSLCLSMFRIIQPYSGTILIDGVDITELGLDLLRKKLCVIPQQPTLFEGTIRENLDPFKSIEQEELENILVDIELFPNQQPKDILDKQVTENGMNFSLGQRQLICIARAIISKSKIMFLDEATASVDYKTDELIQVLIREKFKDRTVLTIAHRINTIMDYDRIMVMDKGVIAQFDSPQNLLAEKGIFYSLVKRHKNLK